MKRIRPILHATDFSRASGSTFAQAVERCRTDAQARASAAAHWPQNFVPAGFSAWQREHFMPAREQRDKPAAYRK